MIKISKYFRYNFYTLYENSSSKISKVSIVIFIFYKYVSISNFVKILYSTYNNDIFFVIL